MLRAIRAASERGIVDLYPTFLGAHTVPPEFPDAAEYVEFAIREVLPEAASANSRHRTDELRWRAV